MWISLEQKYVIAATLGSQGLQIGSPTWKVSFFCLGAKLGR
jgi:hypothetical protein